jgi:Protein of unknown function (DUF3515)
VSLRCGVAVPSGLGPTSQLIAVNDVDWYVEERTDDVLFATTDRTAVVELSVPRAHTPEPEVLVDLAAPVSATVPIAPSS